jgi:iron complex transport system permease protein
MHNEAPAPGSPVVYAAAAAFQRQSSQKTRFILGLSVLTLVLAVIAINAGAANTNPLQVLRALLGLESGIPSVVIWNIGLPRVVAGIGLAVSGCVMQTCLRNPLASPFTLGISNAAAFGANLAIVFLGASTLYSNIHDAVFIGNPYAVTISAFIFSMAAMIMILLLSETAVFRRNQSCWRRGVRLSICRRLHPGSVLRRRCTGGIHGFLDLW